MASGPTPVPPRGQGTADPQGQPKKPAEKVQRMEVPPPLDAAHVDGLPDARFFRCARCGHHALHIEDERLRGSCHLTSKAKGSKGRTWAGWCPVISDGVKCDCPKAREL